MAKKSKASRIKAEKKRLEAVYGEISSTRKLVAQGLVERAAFMRVELEDLEADLAEKGWTEKFCQGNQEPYDRARPQGQTYNTTNTNYQKIIKQLDAMLPREEPRTGDDGDGFDDFVTGRDDR